MRFTVLQESLRQALAEVVRVVPSKSTLPIVANVHIATVAGQVVLTVDNLSQRIEATVGAKVEEEGAITVDARKLNAAIATLPPVSLTVYLDKTQLAVDGGNAKLRFPTMSADDFPRGGGDIDWRDAVEVPAEEFRTVSRHVAGMVASDDTRQVLTAVNFLANDGERTWVAADGFRLAIYGLPETLPGVNIPAEALRAVVAKGSEPIAVAIAADGQRVRFQWQDRTLTTLAISGTFPNYQQLIPEDFQHTATFYAAEELLNAVRVAGGFTEDSKDPVRLQSSGNDAVRVSAKGTGDGEATVSATITGEVRVALSKKYAEDALAAFNGELVMSGNGTQTQWVFTAPDNPLTVVVMPMFVQWESGT